MNRIFITTLAFAGFAASTMIAAPGDLSFACVVPAGSLVVYCSPTTPTATRDEKAAQWKWERPAQLSGLTVKTMASWGENPTDISVMSRLNFANGNESVSGSRWQFTKGSTLKDTIHSDSVLRGSMLSFRVSAGMPLRYPITLLITETIR